MLHDADITLLSFLRYSLAPVHLTLLRLLSKIDSADAHKKTSALSILQTGDFLVSKFLILYYKVPEMDVLHEYIPLLLLLF